ncbi:MAG: hypothetical protein M3Q39_10650 [Actinomycetota bacterium]|nr:hypothetical protein [Actinomycetota bacterium]
MTATMARKKVRYFSKETNKLAWDYPENLPEYARVAAEVVAETIAELDAIMGPEKANDYSDLIEQFRDELRLAVGDRRAARDNDARVNALARAEKFKEAIDIYTAAESVPAQMTQFGSYRNTFHFRVPPRTEEYDDLCPLRKATAHRYLTADPVEIAYLRTIDEYEEVPIGFVYSRPPGGRDGIWVPLAIYEQQRKINQAV